MATLLDHLRNKMLKDRLVGVCGSYTWAQGVALKALLDFAHSGGWELVDPQVEMKSAPNGEILTQCALLGEAMAAKLKACYL
jgi:flavorubredoxin